MGIVTAGLDEVSDQVLAAYYDVAPVAMRVAAKHRRSVDDLMGDCLELCARIMDDYSDVEPGTDRFRRVFSVCLNRRCISYYRSEARHRSVVPLGDAADDLATSRVDATNDVELADMIEAVERRLSGDAVPLWRLIAAQPAELVRSDDVAERQTAVGVKSLMRCLGWTDRKVRYWLGAVRAAVTDVIQDAR